MKGKFAFSVQQDINEGYRKILCAMIKQAILHALGREMSDLFDKKQSNYRKMVLQEKNRSIAYIQSEDFELHMLWLGLEHHVSAVRDMVERGEFQQTLFMPKLTNQDREEIKRDWMNGYKTGLLAHKYGITQKTVQNIVRDLRPYGWREINKSRKVEMEAV